MALTGVLSVAQALAETGASHTAWMHKTSAPTPGAAGQWGDLSMGAGTPKFNAYVGAQLEFTPLVNTNNAALYLPDVGATASSSTTKVITQVGIQTTQGTQNTPNTWCLADYLGFYPLIDGDSVDPQDMTNGSAIPRYADGAGVRAFLVCTSPMTQNGTITVTYTNSAGTSGRSVTAGVATSSTLGPVINYASTTVAANTATPFLPLANNDAGVRSVQSVTMGTTTGGFFALVLCKPLAWITTREASTWTECDTLIQGGRLPRIYDGAFLQFLFNTSGTGNPATVRGCVTTAWG